MKKLQQLDTESDLIPTSSMADIAFLLIIYFMITITFSATQGLDLALPEDDTAEVVETIKSVLIKIEVDGGLLVDGNPLPLSDLLPYLAPKLERNPRKPVIIQPDPASNYGAMMDVYDELRQGRRKLGLQDEIQIALPTRSEISQFWY